MAPHSSRVIGRSSLAPKHTAASRPLVFMIPGSGLRATARDELRSITGDLGGGYCDGGRGACGPASRSSVGDLNPWFTQVVTMLKGWSKIATVKAFKTSIRQSMPAECASLDEGAAGCGSRHIC